MATTKQKLVIGKLLENDGNVYRAMVAAGYSEASAHNSHRLAKSKGFQELLEEHLPDNFLLEALEEDIKLKKGNRHKELDLAFKVKGKLTPNLDKPPIGDTYNTQINVNDNTPRGQEMVDAFTEFMKQQTKRKDDRVIGL